MATGLGSLQVAKALPEAFPPGAGDWMRLEEWGCEKVLENNRLLSVEPTFRESIGVAMRVGYGMGLSAPAIGAAQGGRHV